MDVETAAALTDGILAAMTAALAVTLARVPARRGWAALFALMTVSAALGGLYHGFEALRTDRLWIVISGLALATGPAFLWACVLPADPSWKRRPGAWRWSTVAGFVVGGLIADLRFVWVSAGVGACVLLAAALIARTDRRAYRDRVYAGILVMAVGIVAQATLTGDGLLSGNALFHEIQIAANVLFFAAARRLPAE